MNPSDQENPRSWKTSRMNHVQKNPQTAKTALMGPEFRYICRFVVEGQTATEETVSSSRMLEFLEQVEFRH